MTSADRDRIERALEGLLPENERLALEADILRDPALRAAYAEQLWLHASLHAGRDRLPDLLPQGGAPFEDERPLRARRARFLAWAAGGALAAGLVFAFVLLTARRGEGPPMFATMAVSDGARWASSTLPTAASSRLGTGTLALVEGVATLHFDSGASLTLEAPSTLEMIDALSCRLLEGSLTAEVPPAAHGFTVFTPDLAVVDLGTRFGVTTGSAGDSHVFVFEGEVQVNDTAKGATRRLTGGQSFHVRSGPSPEILEPRRFTTKEVTDGWTSIPTSFGRGRDAFVRRGHDAGAGSLPLLMVKHSDLPDSHRNERRAFLTFDLAALPAGGLAIAGAELVLDPKPSGLGFSAMAEDSSFALYGLVDEAFDHWDEHATAWANAPGVSDEGPLTGRTRRLAEFSLPRGGTGGALVIGSPALADFLRSDTNGLVTFILVRETGESHASGLVHAFASKEHPSATPPTLRVR